jgi:membrane protease YdiL (CAAX protease family)
MIAAATTRSTVRGIAEVIRAHPITAYFVLAYAISWGLILVLFGLMQVPAQGVILVQTLGPTVAARIVLTAIGGDSAYRAMRRGGRRWRVGARWYALAVLGLPAACLVAVAVVPGGADALRESAAGAMAGTFLYYLVFGFFSGPLFEEPGWRGFALPRLEAARGPLAGTLILGALWGAWHLPQFFVPEWAAENGGADLGTVVAFLALVMTLSPLLTWVYNRTGSLWMAMVTHAGINASLAIVPAASVSPIAVGIVAFGSIALALLVATRGRLGYAAPAA